MDAIDALDWGAYAHFAEKAKEQPHVVQLMQIGYYASDYLAIGVYFSFAALLFIMQGRHRSAQAAAASLALALVLIFPIRAFVPRLRPPAALSWVGANDMHGSYPSTAVFLFTLAMIMLGFALWDLTRPWSRTLYVLLAAALTIGVFFSQFYLALAFLSDMLGGMAGAAMVGWIAYQFMDRPSAAQNETDA